MHLKKLTVLGLVLGLIILIGSCGGTPQKPVRSSHPGGPEKPVSVSTVKKPEPVSTIKKPVSISEVKEPVSFSEVKNEVIQAFKNMEEADGYHIEGKTQVQNDINGMKMEMEIDIKGVFKKPDLFHATIKMMGQEIEIYRQGTKTVTKDPQIDMWRLSPLPLPSLEPTQQFNALKEHLTNVKLVGEENINDQNCKIMEGDFAFEGLEGLKEAMQQGFRAAVPLFQDMKIEFDKVNWKIWIGKDDNILYKFDSVMNITMSILIEEDLLFEEIEEEGIESEEETDLEETTLKVLCNIKSETRYFDYNKDIDFEVPEEVKEILENESGEENIFEERNFEEEEE